MASNNSRTSNGGLANILFSLWILVSLNRSGRLGALLAHHPETIWRRLSTRRGGLFKRKRRAFRLRSAAGAFQAAEFTILTLKARAALPGTDHEHFLDQSRRIWQKRLEWVGSPQSGFLRRSPTLTRSSVLEARSVAGPPNVAREPARFALALFHSQLALPRTPDRRRVGVGGYS